MFITKYSGSVLKSKLFFPTTSVKSFILFKEISNEPLQKSNAVSETSFANKGSNNVNPQEDSSYHDVGTTKGKEEVAKVSWEPEDSVRTADKPKSVSLIQKRESSEILLNADPFEEVPGPVILKKISTIWKYLPEIGRQATVSTMLSFFNLTQKFALSEKLGRGDSRPFDRLFRKHGPIVKLQGPLGADIVLLCKPEHVAKVYDQEGNHPIRSTLDSVERCRALTRKSSVGPFNLMGVEWEEMRRALQQPLSKGGEKYFQAIENAADTFVRRIRGIRNKQNEVGDDFMMEVTKWSMECLCFVTLGRSLGFLSSDISHSSAEPLRLLKALMDATKHLCNCESGFQFWRFINTPSSLGLTQACEIIDSYFSKHIRLAQVNLTKNKEELLGQGKPETDLSFIENLLLNECMAPDEVLTCIVDLLLLGVNTTSSSLAFTLYHLAQNQRSQRTLFKEVKEILPEKQTKLEYDKLSSMKYLNACFNESLRLRMPMPTLTRILPHDISLSNFRIPKGTYMVMDVQSTCLKEQNFEKSDKFLPERWFDVSNIQPFSFIPFGYGSRSCIGKHLAEAQVKSCVAKIIRNYQIEYNYGEIRGTPTVISFPDRPLKLSFTEREE